MKKSFSLFFVTSAIVFAGYSQSVENTVRCVQLDPLEKVFTEESYFVENPETAAVAKGETATFQFVVRSIYPIQGLKVEAGNLVNGNHKIAATLKAFVGYIRAGSHARTPSRDAIYPVSDYYPDCLTEVETMDVPSMHNQPVWVSYDVPRDAADGNYSATLVFTGKIDGKPFKITRQVNAKVYPVTLSEQTLWVTNWFTTGGFSKMNGDKPVELYSDRYWELLTAMARVMRAHRQNMYWIWQDDGFSHIGNLFNVKLSGAQYSFDFTNFDKTVELFIREGGLTRIEGGLLGGGCGKVCDGKIGVYMPNNTKLPFDDEKAQNFLSQFLPALYSHLEKKGWKDMYVQHVWDEPNDMDLYNRFASFVKKYLPGIPTIDAGVSQEMTNYVNIWVPQLEKFHSNYSFFQERQKAGDEVWFYTCTGPQGNYANRFLEQPLVQTRYLHWINYRYGATGYLHWGFNWWHWNKLNDWKKVIDASINHWPAGDCWIVYPTEGKVYSSIRLAAMRDGIADYELLKLLEKKSPDRAKSLAGAVVRDFDSYDNNVRRFRYTRLKLLEELSK